MAAPQLEESAVEVDELELVTVQKYGLDLNAPWWSKLWFYLVFIPLFRISFNIFRVPSPGGRDADGRVWWHEDICIATDSETAASYCADDFYEHHALPVNCPLPRASVQYSRHVYAKSKKPDRYKLAFPRVQSVEEISKQSKVLSDLAEISKRILHKSQHSTSI